MHTGATEELLESLQADLERLPEISPRYKRLNAEEPYRLKATCIRQKLENTKQRLAKGTPHEAGRDYLGTSELLADLIPKLGAVRYLRTRPDASFTLSSAVRGF